MFVPVGKVPFSRSAVRLEFTVKRKSRGDLESDFVVAGDKAVPKIYQNGGVSENRVFMKEYQTRSIFLHFGRIIKKGIGVSDGDVNVGIAQNVPDEVKVFLAYATTINILNDRDNRHVRKLFDKKVKLKVNGVPLGSVLKGVHGVFESVETLFDHLDKTMTSYFREQLGKSNVFSVKFLPVSVDEAGKETTGLGVLEVRFRARDGSLYVRNYGVRYGVSFNIGDGFIEDEFGNPVSVRKILSASLVVGGDVLDSGSIKGILRRYTHGTITVESFMRVADPEFFVATLNGSAYIEPEEFLIKKGELGLNFLVTFNKTHVHGSIGDFGVTDLISEAKISVKSYTSPIRAYPMFLLKTGGRTHLIASHVRSFLSRVLADLLLNQNAVSLGYVKPKRHVIVLGDSKIPDEHSPVFMGSEPVAVVSTKGLKEYITRDLPAEPEKYARLPKSFPFKGIIHVGLPHKTKFGTLIPVMTPDKMEEGSRAYIYTILVLGGKLIPIRLSTNIETVEVSV